MNHKTRIGFVSTRLAGTDGVSLETAKWANVLTEMGHECFYFAGEVDWPEERSYVVPEAHFDYPAIRKINIDLFDDYIRSDETTHTIQKLADHLDNHLHQFVGRFELDLLIAENALAIPMNIPLGMALTRVIAETNLPTLAHHHDFAWERERFAVTAADDYLRAAFPPTLHSIYHVVINSFGRRQLALRTGASSTLIPNVMDFESPPPKPDPRYADIRSTMGIGEDECFLLQPTRIVPRKRIEQAIELTRRLEMPCVLAISHTSGDEGPSYENYLREYADIMGVRVLFAGDVCAYGPSRMVNGRKIYGLPDVYQQADLVTYPSTVEGFGNAFLETIYYRRPIVMGAYEIFKTDIKPKGFKVVEFHEFIEEATIRQTREVLQNPDLVAEMVEHNYQLARHHYSYATLEKRLAALVSECMGD